MQSTYLTVLTNFDSEELLKEEINLRFPDLKPSFSSSGYLTYKNSKGILTQKDLATYLPIFALKCGLFYAKTAKKQLQEKLKQLEKEVGGQVFIDPTSSSFAELNLLIEKQGSARPMPGEMVTWITLVDQKECWINIFPFRPGVNFFGHLPAKIPKEAPSRAYLKMAQTFEILQMRKIQEPQNFIEIGCSPGGVAYFLLEEGHSVLGIDTGDMDNKLTSSTMAERLKTLRRPVQEIRKQDIDKALQRLGVQNFEWLANDLNLPIPMAYNEVMRISHYSTELWGLLITLKTPGKENLPQLFLAINKLMGHGQNFPFVHAVHLPAHKKECLLVGLSEKAITTMQLDSFRLNLSSLQTPGPRNN